jgi:hypothetical protein
MNSMNVAIPGVSGVIVPYGGCLVVHATRETTGTASAVYRFWDGVNNQGNLLVPVSLAASESTRDDFRAHHLTFNTALYYELVSGAVEGSVSVLTDHNCNAVLAAILYSLDHVAQA